ncbi:MAG: hypothetical protein ACAH95_00910 [Fimbriimonas sp.]
MRLSRLSPLLLLLALGCAGRTDTTADEISLQLSEPTGASNVNLTRFDTANDWQRTRPGLGLTVTATQTPGPTGLSSRFARAVVGTASVGTEYSLNFGDANYVELSETSTTGTRVWRSESGAMTLLKDDTKISEFLVTNVTMAPYSGNATGRFKIAGKMIIRF